MREAVVLAREDTAGEKRLVAYYTAAGIGEGEAASVGSGEAAAGRTCFGGCSGLHGTSGICADGEAAFDAEREAGPQGAANAGTGGLCGAWV